MLDIAKLTVFETQNHLRGPDMELQPDIFRARERALENAFFLKRDAELLATMRSQLAEMEEQQRVAHVSGILDEHVLLDLIRVGVTAEALLAMRFVPMVAVAWSDGIVSAEEQAAILKTAEAEKIMPGSPAYQLLHGWLERRPEAAVFVAWKEYVAELVRIMPAESLDKLRIRTESLCHQIARTSGGFMGIGSISHAERTAIEEFVGSWKSA